MSLEWDKQTDIEVIKTSFDIAILPKVGFPGGSDYKESASQCRRLVLGSGTSPKKEMAMDIRFPKLENSKARAWQ